MRGKGHLEPFDKNFDSLKGSASSSVVDRTSFSAAFPVLQSSTADSVGSDPKSNPKQSLSIPL